MTASYPRTFFMHLLSIIMLYVSIISMLVLLFQYINIFYPDPLSFYYASVLGTIRSSISTLIIVFPVFAAAQWFLHKEMKARPETINYRVRKWLLFLTIFLAGLAIIIDLVTLVNSFLSGEMTIRFILKVLSVLIVTGLVFGYELFEVRRESFTSSSTQKIFSWSSFVLVIALICSSFFIVGSPANQRKIRLDEQRISNLQIIQSEIIYFWQQKNKLPENTEALNDSIRGFVPPTDPETGDAYEYTVISDLSFELCAVFASATPAPLRNLPSREPYYGNASSDSWVHEKGRTCFERTIDPEIYDNENGLIPSKIRMDI